MNIILMKISCIMLLSNVFVQSMEDWGGGPGFPDKQAQEYWNNPKKQIADHQKLIQAHQKLQNEHQEVLNENNQLKDIVTQQQDQLKKSHDKVDKSERVGLQNSSILKGKNNADMEKAHQLLQEAVNKLGNKNLDLQEENERLKKKLQKCA